MLGPIGGGTTPWMTWFDACLFRNQRRTSTVTASSNTMAEDTITEITNPDTIITRGEWVSSRIDFLFSPKLDIVPLGHFLIMIGSSIIVHHLNQTGFNTYERTPNGGYTMKLLTLETLVLFFHLKAASCCCFCRLMEEIRKNPTSEKNITGSSTRITVYPIEIDMMTFD